LTDGFCFCSTLPQDIRTTAGGDDDVKIAFTHNLRLTDSEDEAEFDTAETVDAIADGLRAGGHEIEKIEVTGRPHTWRRLESYGPDLIFNTAEGRRAARARRSIRRCSRSWGSPTPARTPT